MTLTRHAKSLAQEKADHRRSAEKNEYRRKLLQLQSSFDPPLSSAELADGLELERRELGRFLSESPRLRHARPDGIGRALIDAVLAGDLFIAVQHVVGGAEREVLICDDRDIKRLPTSYRVRNLSGGEVPERLHQDPADWEDDGLWDLFGSGDPPATPQPATPRPAPTLSAPAENAPDPTFEPLASPRPFLGRTILPIGLGAMRLSTGVDSKRPERAAALGLIRRAVDSGCGLIDSADAYALDQDDIGHNEALIAEALKELGPEDRPWVATKCGLTRPGGRWIPNGRPEHLRAACEHSLKQLRVDSLDLLLLHVVDSKVPLAESFGVLARLQEEGKTRHVGLCNVKAEQIRQAHAVAPLAAVQNPANFFDKAALQKGVVDVCAELGIPFLAHSPIGGHAGVGRADRSKVLAKVAARHGVGARQVALAWLLHMAPQVIALPGATREESWEGSLEALKLDFDDEDRRILDGGKQKWAETVRRRLWALGAPKDGSRSSASISVAPICVASKPGDGEVVLFVGPPAGGKTSRVEPYVEKNFLRLNRDELGGKLSDLVVRMGEALEEGHRHFVLDNTYPTRKSRHGILELAARHGLQTRCIWIDTPVEEALYNACLRMLAKTGRILAPTEILNLSKKDPNLLPPAAIFHYFNVFETPQTEEGFVDIERVPFERRAPTGHDRKALLLDYDGTLRRSKGPAPFPLHPDEVEILPGRKEVLDRYAADGWLLLGVSNQSAVGKRQLSPDMAEACFARTNELLGHEIQVLYSPNLSHRSGVWDRKPMPGLGVRLIEEHRLDRARCLMVGDLETDELFAKNCGIPYMDQEAFFTS